MIFIFGIIEQVVSFAVENGLVAVHPGSIDPKYRFGHERRDQVMFGCDSLDSIFKGQHIVGGPQSIRKAEIDFMLANSYFMVSHFHIQSHAVKRIHQFGADAHGFIISGKIEVTTYVMWYRVDPLPSVATEKEKFGFGTYIIGPASFRHLGKDPFQGTARVALERLSIGGKNIAKDARPARFGGTPREHRIGIRVDHQAHITFLDAGESFH